MEQLEATLAQLTQQYTTAVEAKMKCQAEADATTATINLANRHELSHLTVLHGAIIQAGEWPGE